MQRFKHAYIIGLKATAPLILSILSNDLKT